MGNRGVIDVDIHPFIHPKRIQSFLAEPWRTRFATGNTGPRGPGYWNPNGVRLAGGSAGRSAADSPDTLSAQFLDVHGIDFGILNVNYLSFTLSPEADFAASLASAVNQVLVEDWLPTDQRLRASAQVALADPLLAAAEIRRVGGHPGIVQVLLPDGAHLPYGNRFYYPIYEAACENNLRVAIHPGGQGSGISGPPSAVGYPSSYLEWHTGLICSFISHLVSLVTEGVFLRFPALRFVLIECGVSWLPGLLWRLDKNWKALRQTTPWLTRPPSEIVLEHFLFTTQPLEEPPTGDVLERMLQLFPADRMLMFSSDFPHWDSDTPEVVVSALPEALRKPVMSETARALYGLAQ